MTRVTGQSIENNFTRGLITEATGLNFPENSASETYDCIFHERGEVRRRLGFDYETGYAFATVNRRNDHGYVVQEFIWENVGGKADLFYSVIQIGTKIYFWQISSDGSLSSQKRNFTVDLTTYYAGQPQGTSTTVASKESIGETPCQFAVANGTLIVVHQLCNPLYVEYLGFNILAASVIDIQIRDFEAPLSGDFSVTNRPTAAASSRNHIYSLLNQGWGAGNGLYFNLFASAAGVYPSNADVWWLMKNSSDVFDPALRDSNSRGNTRAPNGHFTFNAFNINRSAQYSGATDKVTYVRPTTVAFYAGRAFYAGVYDQGYNTKIYFSQIIDHFQKLGFCYQKYDPTEEDSVGILPNDGGVISVPDIGQIIKMVSVQQFLLVFATNGIWSISGSGDNTGFTATDYTIRKISDIPSLSGNSFVIPKTGLPIWWNSDGIYTLVVDTTKAGLEVTSLTDQTIKTFYNNIPTISKSTAKGAYNPLLNVIQWVYRAANPETNLERYEYDSILNLNLNTNAFYPWTVTVIDGGPTINGVISTKGTGTVEVTSAVTTTTEELVTDASGDQVTITEFSSLPLTSSFRYPCTVFVRDTTSLIKEYNVTFAQENNGDFTDWVTFNDAGEDYESYFITGYKIDAGAQRRFQANAIFVYSTAEEDSSCYVQGIWDFANDDSSGRYTGLQQVYFDRSFYGVQRRKIRLRGKGYSLQLKFQSQATKPFKIIGWSSFETSGKDV